MNQQCGICGGFLRRLQPGDTALKCGRCGTESVVPPERGWVERLPQMERPQRLRYKLAGIHDHHVNAARTDAEREYARAHPHECYDDRRCWWNGGG